MIKINRKSWDNLTKYVGDYTTIEIDYESMNIVQDGYLIYKANPYGMRVDETMVNRFKKRVKFLKTKYKLKQTKCKHN